MDAKCNHKTFNTFQSFLFLTMFSLVCSLFVLVYAEQNVQRITINYTPTYFIAAEIQLIWTGAETEKWKEQNQQWNNWKEWHNQSNQWSNQHTKSWNNQPVELAGIEKLKNYEIHKEVAEAMLSPQYRYIDPKYYAVIGLSENARNPRAIGDGGCSHWPYQFNKCAGNRYKQRWFGKSFVECSKDFVCATRMLNDKIVGAYKCKVQPDGSIPNRKECLPRHQGFTYDGWYKNKIVKYHKLLFGS